MGRRWRREPLHRRIASPERRCEDALPRTRGLRRLVPCRGRLSEPASPSPRSPRSCRSRFPRSARGSVATASPYRRGPTAGTAGTRPTRSTSCGPFGTRSPAAVPPATPSRWCADWPPGRTGTPRVRRGRGRDPPGSGRAAGDARGGGRDVRRGARDLRGRTARDARDGIAMEGRRMRHRARTSGDRGRAGLARAPVGDGPGRVPSVPARPRLRSPRPAHDRPRGVRRDPRPSGMADPHPRAPDPRLVARHGRALLRGPRRRDQLPSRPDPAPCRGVDRRRAPAARRPGALRRRGLQRPHGPQGRARRLPRRGHRAGRRDPRAEPAGDRS